MHVVPINAGVTTPKTGANNSFKSTLEYKLLKTTCLNDQHSQGMSPQLYMSMYGLNNNVQLQYYNIIDIHHLIATSYNHHVNST